MTRLLYLVIGLNLTLQSDAQIVAKEIEKNIDSLKASGIDSIFTYSFYCNGGFGSFDTCLYETPQYLFWISDKRYFIKKFDYCSNYKVIELDTVNPFSFYLKNQELIKKEEIRVPEYIESKKGGVVTTISVIASHTCFYEMSFKLKNQQVKKTVNSYCLTLKSFDNGKKNIHYEYNQKTNLKLLTNRLEELLKKLDRDHRFLRE